MKTNIFINCLSITTVLCLSSMLGNAQRIAAGGWHSLAICTDSTVKAFGENASGQLGNNATTDQNLPVAVTGLTGIVSVSGGGDQLEAHSMALKSDGTVWCWGSNLYGGLGNGTTTNSLLPVQTLLLNNVKAISAGGWHSAALAADSTVWVWGWNSDGQIGDGTLTDRTVPTKVNGLNGIIEIAAGTYHMLALKSDSTVWAWGDNISGQIGNGNTTDQTTPVQVSGLTQVKHISAGRFFSLAVKSDGTVWTWGENLYGQLGNGTTTNSSVPVQVSGLTGITSATTATGAFHCLAEKNDNTIWAWGRNTYGNLGDGTVTHQSLPVQMLGISNVQGMAAGTNFSLLYKDDGTFWGCGRNASGQLGDGTFLQQNTVVQSTSLCSIVTPLSSNDILNDNLIKVLIHPNPSKGFVTMELQNTMATTSQTVSVDIIDMLGKKLKQVELVRTVNGCTKQFDLSALPDGVYLLSIQAGVNSHTQKWVKQ